MDFFSKDYILALRGCCALKFLYTLESDQGLLAHTRRGTGTENLKLALKFSMLESITYGIMEVFSLNFFMRPAITAIPEIDFALGLAAPGGLTSGSAMHL